MYEMGEQLERVILAGVQTYESDDTAERPFIRQPIWEKESWKN